jgi:DNA-binding IscR family transcriptional regulator
MTLTATDRGIVRELLKGSSTQAQLAAAVGVPQPFVTKSLLRLQRAGLVEIPTGTRNRPPKLALFSAVRRLEDSVRSLALAVTA